MNKDNINPDHYKQGKVECIDAIESATVNKPGFEGLLVGNVIKYLWRYEAKAGLEDVKKSKWYLERLIKFKEQYKFNKQYPLTEDETFKKETPLTENPSQDDFTVMEIYFPNYIRIKENKVQYSVHRERYYDFSCNEVWWEAYKHLYVLSEQHSPRYQYYSLLSKENKP
jgi:hypothetical protein